MSSARVGERGGELGVVRGDDHRLARSRATAHELRGERGLRLAVHAARRLVEREHRRRRAPPVTIASARRWRSPPERSRGLRSASALSPTRASALGASLVADALVRGSSRRGSAAAARPCPRARSRPRVGSSRPAAWRSSVDLPAPLRPMQRDASRPRASVERDAAQDRPAAAQLVPDAAHAQRGGGALARLRARALRAAGRAAAPAPASAEQPARAQRRARLLDADRRRAGEPREREHPRPGRLQRRRAVARPVEERARVAVVARAAPRVERDHAIGVRQAALEAVLGEHDRHVAHSSVEPAQQRDQLVAGDRVELRGRLVEQHQPRAARRARRRARRAASRRRRASRSRGRAGGRCRARARPPRRRARPPTALWPRLSSASASSARTELITSWVSGSWKSTPTNAAELRRAVRARVHAADSRPCPRRSRRGSAARGRTRAQQRRLARGP